MKERRTKRTIYYDLIQAILRIPTVEDKNISNIATRSGLNFEVAKLHIKSMIKLELITEKYEVTTKGFSYSDDYFKVQTQASLLLGEYFPDDEAVSISRVKPKDLDDLVEIIDIMKNQMRIAEDWIKAQKENK